MTGEGGGTILSWQITSRSCCKILAKLVSLFKSFWWFSNCSRSNLHSIRRQWPWWQPPLVWCKFVWKQKKIWHHRALIEDNVETELEQSHPFKTTRAHGWDKPARLRFCTRNVETEKIHLSKSVVHMASEQIAKSYLCSQIGWFESGYNLKQKINFWHFFLLQP